MSAIHGLGCSASRISSQEKWLRVHNSQEWPDYYDETNREDLRRFFDHYLKAEDNGWGRTPRVRYALLDLQGGDRVDLAADQFPPAGVTPTAFHLDAGSRTLSTTVPAQEASATTAPQPPTGPQPASSTSDRAGSGRHRRRSDH